MARTQGVFSKVGLLIFITNEKDELFVDVARPEWGRGL
jgi:hypothetical protein